MMCMDGACVRACVRACVCVCVRVCVCTYVCLCASATATVPRTYRICDVVILKWRRTWREESDVFEQSPRMGK